MKRKRGGRYIDAKVQSWMYDEMAKRVNAGMKLEAAGAECAALVRPDGQTRKAATYIAAYYNKGQYLLE